MPIAIGLDDPTAAEVPYVASPQPVGQITVFGLLERGYKVLETANKLAGSTKSRRPDRKRVDDYLNASGDDNPIHREAGVVPGVLLVGMVSDMLKGEIPLSVEGATTMYGRITDIDFHHPVFVDDEVVLGYKLSTPFIFEGNNAPSIMLQCAMRIATDPEPVMTCVLHLRFIETRRLNVLLAHERRRRQRRAAVKQ